MYTYMHMTTHTRIYIHKICKHTHTHAYMYILMVPCRTSLLSLFWKKARNFCNYRSFLSNFSGLFGKRNLRIYKATISALLLLQQAATHITSPALLSPRLSCTINLRWYGAENYSLLLLKHAATRCNTDYIIT